MVVTKHVYEPSERTDGYRVLIDRLWPRGLSKAKAHLASWEKVLAPSEELRHWYDHDPVKWPEFQKRYKRELATSAANAVLDALARRARRSRVTLVYASHAGTISNAAVLERMLRRRATRVTRRTHVSRAAIGATR